MAKKQKTKRVVVIADMHCGHRSGLTPPQWQLNPDNEIDAKWSAIQRDQWAWYRQKIKALRPIHLLLVLGDCVDGKSTKADGRDTIRHERDAQVEMAWECIAVADADNIEMVYGTRYHVQDWENLVFDKVAARGEKRIGAHGWPSVNGCIFDIKHMVGSSSTPYGQMTPLAKQETWNALWAEAGRQPRANIIIRGHVHYHVQGTRMVGAQEVRFLTCPALQGVGSEYGAEQCSRLIDFGFMHFDIATDGSYSWQPHIEVLESQKAQTSKY